MTPVEFRRLLHEHPELSFHEEQTFHFISEALQAAGIHSRRIARTGVLARIEGRGDLSRAVVLRADIDALPIQEEVSVPWRSQNAGVMHACGHDLHTAVLYGVLLRLAAKPDFEGTVFGLFQPGEEVSPGGAVKVLAEDPFAQYDVVAVVGEHVDPSLEVGMLGFREGRYMASNDELRFTLEGKGGHAALRAEHADTVSAAAELILSLTALNTPERLVSIGKVEALGATNVIPDCVYMEGTMRDFDEAERAALKHEIERRAAANDKKYGVQTRVEFAAGYPCVVNDAALTRRAMALAPHHTKLPVRMTSDDFGYYGQRYPAVYYRLGVGKAAGNLHTSAFNPDERAIGGGIDFMERLALNISNN